MFGVGSEPSHLCNRFEKTDFLQRFPPCTFSAAPNVENGTPEERAAKAAAAAEELASATVAEISSRSRDNQRLAAAAGPALVEFLQHLRAYFVQEFARAKEINQIFDDLEGSYRRVEKALR